MPEAFDPKKADFSGMNGGADSLYITDVLQKVSVKVDEKGSQAAAATGITIGVAIALGQPPPPVVFRADHPFVYLIRDTSTNTVLFAGRISAPSSE